MALYFCRLFRDSQGYFLGTFGAGAKGPKDSCDSSRLSTPAGSIMTRMASTEITSSALASFPWSAADTPHLVRQVLAVRWLDRRSPAASPPQMGIGQHFVWVWIAGVLTESQTYS